MQSKIIQEKVRQTNIERYGVPCVLSSEIIREKIKQTCLKRYGVENPSQHPEIVKKILRSTHRHKDYTLPSGNIIVIQGYEGFCLDDLFEEGYDETELVVGLDNIPVISYVFKNGDHRYFPDIYIPSDNKIIEVKSRYTLDQQKEKNIAKAKACIDQGYYFEFRVYNEKGNLMEIITDINNM